jgi:hypothetical protein
MRLRSFRCSRPGADCGEAEVLSGAVVVPPLESAFEGGRTLVGELERGLLVLRLILGRVGGESGGRH